MTYELQIKRSIDYWKLISLFPFLVIGNLDLARILARAWELVLGSGQDNNAKTMGMLRLLIKKEKGQLGWYHWTQAITN